MSWPLASYYCVLCVSRPGTLLTVQALSEDDYRFWLHAMGGKEPVSYLHLSSNTHFSYLKSQKYILVYFSKTWKSLRCLVFQQIGHSLERTYSKERGSMWSGCSQQSYTWKQLYHFDALMWFIFSLLTTAVDAQLDDVGLSFLKNSINAIETRGELRGNVVAL